MELMISWMFGSNVFNRFAMVNWTLMIPNTSMAYSDLTKCRYLWMNLFLSNTPQLWPALILSLWTTIDIIELIIVWREVRMDRCVNLVVVVLKFILVVRTTKINFNIKEAKDPMDHGSSPAVVVKSNVIILWVIIHQWAGVLRPLLLGQCWGTQSNTGVKGVSGLSFLYADGAINIMFEPDIPLETNEKGWLLLSKLCVNCEWISQVATWSNWEPVGSLGGL